jgi:hypothetical protein
MTRRPRISKTRLEEMTEEATVDCYNDSEKITGWFTMIEENVSIPFEVIVLGVPVIVEKVDLTSADQIIAECARGRHRQAIPILNLPLPDSPPRGWEWVEAYRLWNAQTGASQLFEE